MAGVIIEPALDKAFPSRDDDGEKHLAIVNCERFVPTWRVQRATVGRRGLLARLPLCAACIGEKLWDTPASDAVTVLYRTTPYALPLPPAQSICGDEARGENFWVHARLFGERGAPKVLYGTTPSLRENGPKLTCSPW